MIPLTRDMAVSPDSSLGLCASLPATFVSFSFFVPFIYLWPWVLGHERACALVTPLAP